MGVKIDAEGRKLSNAIEELWEFGAFIICQPWLRNILPLVPDYSKMCQNKITLSNFITKVTRIYMNKNR